MKLIINFVILRIKVYKMIIRKKRTDDKWKKYLENNLLKFKKTNRKCEYLFMIKKNKWLLFLKPKNKLIQISGNNHNI